MIFYRLAEDLTEPRYSYVYHHIIVNLSNLIDIRSDDAHIVAEEDSLYATWWETAKNGT